MRITSFPIATEPRRPTERTTVSPPAPSAPASQDTWQIADRSRLVARLKSWLDYRGTLALESLSRSGALDRERDLAGKGTLLEHLASLATMPLAPGLDRPRLMNALIQQVADPGKIKQGNRGTCMVTTLEYSLARRDPAEYVRLVAGLASPTGTVRSAGGPELKRVTDSLEEDRSGRTDASRLFEAAVMDLANGFVDYSNRGDRHGFGKWLPFPGGLLSLQVARAATALTGKHHEAVEVIPLLGRVPFKDWGGNGLMKKLEQTLARDGQAPVMLDWRGLGEKSYSGHTVLALKIEGGRVFFRNPWGSTGATGSQTDGVTSPVRIREADGGIESLSLEDFKHRLQGFIRPSD